MQTAAEFRKTFQPRRSSPLNAVAAVFSKRKSWHLLKHFSMSIICMAPEWAIFPLKIVVLDLIGELIKAFLMS